MRVVDDERVEEAVEDVGAEVVVVGDIEGFVGEALSSEGVMGGWEKGLTTQRFLPSTCPCRNSKK